MNIKDLTIYPSDHLEFAMDYFGLTVEDGYKAALKVKTPNYLKDEWGVNPLLDDNNEPVLDPEEPFVYKKTSNSVKTALKEKVGEAVIEKYDLWNVLFPGNIGVEKVTDKKRQKMGLDFIVTMPNERIGIDLKSLVGEFHMEVEDFKDMPTRNDLKQFGASYEVSQLGKFSTGPDKKNKYFLYTLVGTWGIRYALIPKVEVEAECCKYWNTGRNKLYGTGKYNTRTSNNGTGVYVMIPTNYVELPIEEKD